MRHKPGWLRRGQLACCGLMLSGLALAADYGAAAGSGEIRDPAAGWDHLWHDVLIDLTIIGVIFAAVTAWFLFKYRASAAGAVGTAPRLSKAAAIGWVVIPVFVFMADDLYVAASGWTLYNKFRDVPADRMEIGLESGMYAWDFTYPNGVHAQNELRVPVGKPIMMRMTSRDTIHSFFVPDFRVKEDSMPGRFTFLWFYPREAGEHVITCTEYCGVMHSYMAGKVIAMPEAEFKTWLDAEAAKLPVKKANADGGKPA